MAGPGTRVRYDRMTALLVATGVTVFALLAGVGDFGPLATASGVGSTGDQASPEARSPARPATGSSQTRNVARVQPHQRLTGTGLSAPTAPARAGDDPDASKVAGFVPTRGGTGRRVVFDTSAQRVWLVGADDAVLRSYLVSGSVTDNLGPGSYQLYSRSLNAVGIDDSGTMQYFIRVARGNNAAIGFHDIPMDDGKALQTQAQLGEPQSHGCIRQARPDAIRLWNFAPVGTPVDVVA